MPEAWLSKERLLSNSTPRFLNDDEELREQPSSVRQCSRLILVGVLGPIINTSVFSEFIIELFFQCLGSLCTFYFIYKIVSVQNIVQMYAEQHTGAGCESINKRRSRCVGFIA